MFVRSQRDLLVADRAAPGVHEAALAALPFKNVVLFPETGKVGAGGTPNLAM